LLSEKSQSRPVAGLYFDGAATATNSTTPFLCPIADDDRFPKTSVNLLNVHGRLRQGRSVSAKACSVQFASGGSQPTIFCTATKSITRPFSGSASGAFVVSFSGAELKPAWGIVHFNDFGYVEIRFSDNSPGNYITGLFLAE